MKSAYSIILSISLLTLFTPQNTSALQQTHGRTAEERAQYALNRNNLLTEMAQKRARSHAHNTLGKRPEVVQHAIDEAFEDCKKRTYWGTNGRKAYGLLSLSNDLLLHDIVASSSDEEIYILDVGCGNGAWGNNAMTTLVSHEDIFHKHVHIISMTGGHECEEKIEVQGNITHYVFNQFKIENIDEELEERGFNLKNTVVLIVSSWTMQHVIDPFGTLKRMYSLLKPPYGMLFFTGFLFAESTHIKNSRSCPFSHPYFVLSPTSSVIVQRRTGHPDGNLLLVRRDCQELDIQLNYTHRFTSGVKDCAPRMIPIYKRCLSQTEMNDDLFLLFENEYGGEKTYCNNDDQPSKDLWKSFVAKGLF